MKPTQEQELIVQEAKELKVGQTLKINASAGTGKSSSLIMASQELLEPSLLLVFNKAAQLDAAARFPRHVECRTTHSLAYGVTGLTIAHKLSRPKGNYVNVAYTGSEIAKYLKIAPSQISQHKILPASYIGLLVRLVVTRFEQSADGIISKKLIGSEIRELEKEHDVSLTNLTTDIIVLAKKLWSERIDPNSPVLASHDTYLKMYQLSKPVLRYNVIYLDESQDSSACVVNIIQNQPTTKVILVGDTRQAIYGWRGAVNAMESFIGKTLQLSTSFRYGPDVANIANKILGNTTNITSFEGLHTEVGEDVIDKSKPYTILYRTNSKLILDAVDCIAKGIVVNVEIDVRDFCNLLTSALALYRNEISKVKHEDLLCFNNWAEFKVEAEESASYERIVKLIESGAYYRVISVLESHKNVANPAILFTTGHKAKGREFEQVELASDFPSHYVNNEWKGLTTEEQNLLYVAATRARKVLEINKPIKELTNKDLFKDGFKSLISEIVNEDSYN